MINVVLRKRAVMALCFEKLPTLFSPSLIGISLSGLRPPDMIDVAILELAVATTMRFIDPILASNSPYKNVLPVPLSLSTKIRDKNITCSMIASKPHRCLVFNDPMIFKSSLSKQHSSTQLGLYSFSMHL